MARRKGKRRRNTTRNTNKNNGENNMKNKKTLAAVENETTVDLEETLGTNAVENDNLLPTGVKKSDGDNPGSSTSLSGKSSWGSTLFTFSAAVISAIALYLAYVYYRDGGLDR